MRPVRVGRWVIVAGLVVALVAVAWRFGLNPRGGGGPQPAGPVEAPTVAAAPEDEPAPADASPPIKDLELSTEPLDDGGLSVASPFTGPIADPLSLRDLRSALEERVSLGSSILGARLDQVKLTSQSTKEEMATARDVYRQLGLLALYAGRAGDASGSFQRALELASLLDAPPGELAELRAWLGTVALHASGADELLLGVGPAPHTPPLTVEQRRDRQTAGREAVRRFGDYLKDEPGDLRVRWLLNVAHMAIGDYPNRVPAEFRIAPEAFGAKAGLGPFENVAGSAGLSILGPNQGGGCAFDDFNRDGRPDLLTTSLDADMGVALALNQGDGTFRDASAAGGLADQVCAANLAHADYDNDGDLDAVLLRNAAGQPLRLSLLRNRNDGTFDDVTAEAGLGTPIASQAGAWADFDNDGHLDLFVCGESLPPAGGEAGTRTDRRNLCRLYRNLGNGSFADVAPAAGLAIEGCCRGAAWGDFDADGKPDLFVANLAGPSRLLHNEGDGTFRDVAAARGVVDSEPSLAGAFWDFDNDGRLDLLVTRGDGSLAETVARYVGLLSESASRPRLYRNLGAEGFREVGREVGLDQPLLALGCDFGDFDNDGFLDLYLGTGARSVSALVPNLMVRNVGGTRFEDVTVSSGTGSLSKGNGVACADFDGDGDLDLFVECGGAVPGDQAANLLFRNPLQGRHALRVRLRGKRTNRSAFGARIRATVRGADGSARDLYRTVGFQASGGGHSLETHLGLLDATRVEILEVTWPGSGTTQSFRDVAADRAIEIFEGEDTVRPARIVTAPRP